MNQNPGFLALGILFYRWHNLQAEEVAEQNPEWTDEDVFQVRIPECLLFNIVFASCKMHCDFPFAYIKKMYLETAKILVHFALEVF